MASRKSHPRLKKCRATACTASPMYVLLHEFHRWVLFGFVALSTVVSADAGRLRGGRPSACPQNFCRIRPQDQIWLISTRRLGNRANRGNLCSPRLCYFRFTCEHGWVESCEDEFFATDDSNTITTVFVHGNRVNDSWAKDRGFKMYCELKCDLPANQPIRHVIWSWPSEPLLLRIAFLRDIRIKARRTSLQSYYLAWWMSRLQPDLRVSLIGFSFGSRTILGATHVLGGGQLHGRCLSNARCCQFIQPRIALMATASQADWILPGNRYGNSICQIDRGLVFYNCDDPALRRYKPLLCESTGPALGYVGVVGAHRLAGNADKLSIFDATCLVGRYHRFEKYRQSTAIMGQIRRYALWRCVD